MHNLGPGLKCRRTESWCRRSYLLLTVINISL